MKLWLSCIDITDIVKKMGGVEEVMKVTDVRKLVNGPLSPVGILEDNALRWEIFVGNFTVALETSLLFQLWNFLDYLSGLGIVRRIDTLYRYNSELERGLFIL